MLRVGLIGCGGIGAVHARCWLGMGKKAGLVAIADTYTAKAEALTAGYDIQIYTDAVEMMEKEELDVVDICVPTFLHADYVIGAMKYVKNIIVEKPICLNEEEAQKLLEAEKASGALIQVGHATRFNDAYRYLKELVDSGKYGKVIAGSFSRISPRPVWMKGHDEMDRTGTMALDLHIHDVDYVRYLMGREPDEVSAQAVKDEKGIVQHIWTEYRFGSTVLTAEGSWDYPVQMPFAKTYRVRLEKAALLLDANGVLTVYPDAGESYVPELGKKEKTDLGINTSDLGLFRKEISTFVATILRGDKKDTVTLADAVASFRLAKRELDLVYKVEE